MKGFTVEDCLAAAFPPLKNLAFPHLQEEVELNEALTIPLRIMNDGIITKAWRHGRKHFSRYQKTELRDLSNITSATLALRHGRILLAEDPHYGYLKQHTNPTGKTHRQDRFAPRRCLIRKEIGSGSKKRGRANFLNVQGTVRVSLSRLPFMVASKATHLVL